MKTEKFQLEGKPFASGIEAEWAFATADYRRAEPDPRQYCYTFHIPERRHIKDRRDARYSRPGAWVP
jgi:hypothetical protein